MTWTRAETAALRRLYPTATRMDIHLALRRPWGQIYRQARALGLSRPGRYDPVSGHMGPRSKS